MAAPPEVRSQLAADESLIACFEPDLDQRLHFTPGLVCLTERRLLTHGGDGAGWESWPLEALAGLRTAEQGGAGTLEALGPEGRLSHWRYTAARSSAAQQFAERGRNAIRRRSQSGKRGGGSRPKGLSAPPAGASLRRTRMSAPSATSPRCRRQGVPSGV